MTWQDIVNGSFELFGAFAIFISVRALYKAKKVLGVSPLTFSFFAAWGLWNLFYYPHLGQMFSFLGGIAVVVMNIIWVTLAIYYIKKESYDK